MDIKNRVICSIDIIIIEWEIGQKLEKSITKKKLLKNLSKSFFFNV